MDDFISLACPNCKGNLEFKPENQHYVCTYCRNEYLLRQTGNSLILEPVVQELKGIRVGVDRTASELALNRLKSEILDQEKQKEQVENWIKNSKMGCVGLSVSFFLLAYPGIAAIYFSLRYLFAHPLNLQDVSSRMMVGILILGLGMLSIFVYFVFLRPRKIRAKGNQRLEIINQSLTQLYQEREKHQRIVKS